jgi:LysR family transcriptional regulator, low CO2-responsive transcriptional regulator
MPSVSSSAVDVPLALESIRGRIDSRITLRKLEVLCLVSELGSVTAAADRLHIAPSAISEQLRVLQDRLGATLLVRRGGRMVLTAEGAVVESWAREVLALTRRMEERLGAVAADAAEHLAVGASTTLGRYVLPRLLSDLAAETPGLRPALHVAYAETALAGVDAGRLDLAVVAHASGAPRGVTLEHVYDEEIVLVSAPGSDWPERLDVRALDGVAFVCSPYHVSRERLLDGPLERAGIPSRTIVAEFSDPEARKDAVRRGLGVALLMRCAVASGEADGTLRVTRLDGRPLAAQVHVGYRQPPATGQPAARLLERVRALRGGPA